MWNFVYPYDHRSMTVTHLYSKVPIFKPASKLIHVIVETPEGSRNKFTYDPNLELFRLKKVLPAGMSFPHAFGFIPNTLAEDGDPIDVLIWLSAPTFTGCLIECRVIGILKVEQTNDGRTIRNDRILAVGAVCNELDKIDTPSALGRKATNEIQTFFENYLDAEGTKINLLGLKGPREAFAAIKLAAAKATKQTKESATESFPK